MNLWRRIRRTFEPRITTVSAHAHDGIASVLIINGRTIQLSTEIRCPRCGYVDRQQTEKADVSD